MVHGILLYNKLLYCNVFCKCRIVHDYIIITDVALG